jgi:hypothetical protein
MGGFREWSADIFILFWNKEAKKPLALRERADPIRASRGREGREPEKQLAIIYIVNDEATTRRPLSPDDPVTEVLIFG